MNGLQGSFATTMKRISEAMSLGQGSGLCVLVVFMVVVFVILWRLFYPCFFKKAFDAQQTFLPSFFHFQTTLSTSSLMKFSKKNSRRSHQLTQRIPLRKLTPSMGMIKTLQSTLSFAPTN